MSQRQECQRKDCTNQIAPQRIKRGARFCSAACRSTARQQRYHAVNYAGDLARLAAGTRGAVSELQVAVALLEAGYEVFRALSPSCSCDLAILKDGRLLRVEVRTGFKTPAGTIHAPRKHRADVLAIVVAGQVTFEPPLA